MNPWKVAGGQMDVVFGDNARNLAQVRGDLRRAAATGAKLVAFPECALTGYCFTSREEAMPFAETIPGPATEAVAADCRELGVWAAFGLLERDGNRLFNACALVGPGGEVKRYRKVHMPYIGVDRFCDPGDEPFAVHDLGGLRVGMLICYDGSFPEAARVLALKGADLIVLPTNWPTGAVSTMRLVVPTRALENHVFYLAVNRVGSERGFEFIGQSRLVNVWGDVIASGAPDRAEIMTGTVDPSVARAKRIVKVPGQYELDRIRHRRPEMYGALVEPVRDLPE